MSHCVSPHTLRLLLDGALADPALHETQEHVDQCPHCLSLLDQFSEDAELRTWIGSAPRQPPSEPALDRLMSELVDTKQGRSGPTGSQGISDEASIVASALQFTGHSVEAELGRGGMGIVVKAHDLALNRAVAIKILRPERNAEPASRQRFLNEARATASLKHDHVVQLYAVIGPENLPPYMVMEFVDGPTLRQRLEQTGPLPPRGAAEYCAQIGSGLAAAHAAGLIHRDVKPANILLDLGSARAKLMDFGLARTVDGAGLTLDGELMGTPAYMSPEQIRQPESVDERSDVYSLGATLYEAMTGVEPFRGTAHGVMLQVLHEEPRKPRLINESIPQDLETICLKALAKEPAGRYRSAAAFTEDLRRWLRGEPILARPPGPTGRLWRWSKRNPRVAVLGGLVAALLIFACVGSLLFAGRLATEKNETTAALGIAEHNARAARLAETHAVANAEEARELGAAALEAHSALIFKVQEQLGNKAGTLPLRKHLLETALAGLQKIVKLPHGPDSERSIQGAYERMSDVLSALGRSHEAWIACQTATELAQKRADRLPENPEAQRDLALALEKLGTFRYVEHNFKDALTHFTKAHDIRVALVKNARRPELERELAVSFNKLGDVAYFTGQLDQAEHNYLEALQLTREAASADAANKTYERDLRFSYGRLVMLNEGRRNFAEAARYEKLAVQAAGDLAKADPANTLWQHDFAFTSGQAGVLDLKLDHVPAALEHFQTYLNVSEKLLARDPDNVTAMRDVGLACQRLAEGQLRAGLAEQAQGNASRAVQIFERILQKDPANVPVRIDLAIACLRQADIHERLGQYRAGGVACGRAVEAMKVLEKDGKIQGSMLVGLQETSRASQDACQQASAIKDFAIQSLKPDSGPWLVALWSLSQARQSHWNAAETAADRLCILSYNSAFQLAIAARVYALCAAQKPATKSENGDEPLDASARERCRDKALKVLAEILRQSPAYEWHLEPDFNSIRPTTGFRQLLGLP